LIKNLPFLISLLILGISSSRISMNGHLPAFFEWTLPIMSIVLNATAVIGLSLHLFVYKPMKQAEDNLSEVIK